MPKASLLRFVQTQSYYFSYHKNYYRFMKEVNVFNIDAFETIRHILTGISSNLNWFFLHAASGKTLISNLQVLLSSCNATLKDIEHCFKKGHLGNAFVLARKYRDDLMQFLTFELVLLDRLNIIQDHEDKMYEILNGFYHDNSSMNVYEKTLSFWLESIDLSPNKSFENGDPKLLRGTLMASKYRDFIRTKNGPALMKLFVSFLDSPWERVNRVLNDYVHNNGLSFIKDNLAMCNANNRSKLIEVVVIITSIFLCSLGIANGAILRSEDYTDFLESNMERIEGSQYFIMPCIEEFFLRYLPKISEGLLEYMKANISCGMIF